MSELSRPLAWCGGLPKAHPIACVTQTARDLRVFCWSLPNFVRKGFLGRCQIHRKRFNANAALDLPSILGDSLTLLWPRWSFRRCTERAHRLHVVRRQRRKVQTEIRAARSAVAQLMQQRTQFAARLYSVMAGAADRLRAVEEQRRRDRARIENLVIEKRRCEERCQELEQQLAGARQEGRRLNEAPHFRVADEDSSVASEVSEASWMVVGDAMSGSAVTESSFSGTFAEATGPCCFVAGTMFKGETGSLVRIEDVRQGSRILAANGSVVEVASPPTQHLAVAACVVKLRVTRDHRVPIAGGQKVPAHQLHVGQQVQVQGRLVELTWPRLLRV
ncbi:unnamed protein product [Symbiodinium sp. CCMP2456]|nr:unnamed protein product [Symbiodinium sp. CCMP2456]